MLRARDARPDDYAAFGQFWVWLGIVDRPPPPRDNWEANLLPNTFFLEADDGTLAAYGLVFPQGARGDVRQIVVAPAYRGQHVGRQVMEHARERLRAAGCRDWRLEVKADNVPAIALYKRMGMRVLGDLYQLHLPLDAAERFAKPGDTVAVAPHEEAALEDRYDYGRNELGRWRAFGRDALIWRIGERAFARMWRDFDETTSLLFPFRAANADDAAALVAAALASRRPEKLEIMTSDTAARDALVAAGANVYEHQLEMGAAI